MSDTGSDVTHKCCDCQPRTQVITVHFNGSPTDKVARQIRDELQRHKRAGRDWA